MRIQTENLTVDPDLCKRLDRAIYGSVPALPDVQLRADVYRSEMIALLSKYNTELAEKIQTRGLYHIYCMLERVILDESAHVNERMTANAHTAHTQRYRWDKGE